MSKYRRFRGFVSLNINIKLLSNTAKIPTAGSDGAAGRDLYADIPRVIKIRPGAVKLIPTGIAMEIPNGYFGAIYPRSGLAVKNGLRLANCTAIIDEDYRGEIFVALINDSDEIQKIERGMRIAQIVIQKYEFPEFMEEGELTNTVRGVNGLGSTGR